MGNNGGFADYDHGAGEGPPRATVLAALARFEREGRPSGHALDLGCGTGRDTVELLRRGWQVTAVDQRPEALARLCERAATYADRLVPLQGDMSAIDLPRADLVVASFALFLCRPERFPGLWTRIGAALTPGGRFAGQLLGPQDDWAKRPGLTIHDRQALDALLDGYAVELLEEERSDTVTPRGARKHWHVWHLVLRRGASIPA